MLTRKEQHQLMVYPEVRITATVANKTAIGSGTILYSQPLEADNSRFETYVLTNEHVVDGLIKVEKKWSALLRREIKMDILGTPQVETFEFDYVSRVIGGTSYQAGIATYDKDEDLALLRLDTPRPFPHVARLYPRADFNKLVAFMPIVTVGCGMGNKPVMTFGYLSGFGYEIENKDYILCSAASVFGNSGGATFLHETGEFIGVPARITVAVLGWSADVVTHLGFSIPVWRVYQFLEDQIFQFVYDDTYTAAQCAEMREKKRSEEELRMLRDELAGADN